MKTTLKTTMKTIKTGIVALVVLSMTTSCTEPAQNKSESTTRGKKDLKKQKEVQSTKPASGNETVRMDDAQMTAITDGDLQLKNALTHDDTESANKEAEILAQSLAGNEGSLATRMRNHARCVATASDIEEQRKSFERWSSDMYKVLKSNGSDKTLYWRHCPMAFDGKGANWLSATKEVRNPYLGENMLNCGKVKSTLSK